MATPSSKTATRAKRTTAKTTATRVKRTAKQAPVKRRNDTMTNGDAARTVEPAVTHAEDTEMPRTRMRPRHFEPLVPKTLGELQQHAKIAIVASGGDAADARQLAEMTQIMQTGMELGLLPGEAVANLFVTNGRVAMSSEYLRARVFASGLVKAWDYTYDEKTETATLLATRADNDASLELRLHLSDFKHMTNSNSAAWRSYPRRMLSARISAYMVRDLFPDVIRGVVSFDEAAETLDKDELQRKLANVGIETDTVESDLLNADGVIEPSSVADELEAAE